MLSAKSTVSFACLLVCVLAARLDFHAALQVSSNRLEAEECETTYQDPMEQLLKKYLRLFLNAVWKAKGQPSDFCKDVNKYSDDVAVIMADDVWPSSGSSYKALNSNDELINNHNEWIDALPESRGPWTDKFKKCVPRLESLSNVREVCKKVVENPI